MSAPPVSLPRVETPLSHGFLGNFLARYLHPGVAAGLAGHIASINWLDFSGWIQTCISYAILWWIAFRNPPWRSFLFGGIFGAVAISGAFWWAEDMMAYVLNTEGLAPKAVFIGLVLWEALAFALASGIGAWLYRKEKILGYLFAITIFVAFGVYWPRIFRWEIGHVLLSDLPMAQLAEVGGGAILSIVVVMFAIAPMALLDACQKTHFRGKKIVLAIGALGLVAPFANYLWGNARLAWIQSQCVSAPKTILGCVQDFPSDRDSIKRMHDRSNLELKNVDLLCWPESTLGVHSPELTSFQDLLEVDEHSIPPMIDPTYLKGLEHPLLVGGRCFQGEKHDDAPFYQTAYLLDPETRILSKYHKRGLMPFGEYVPAEDYLPFLHDWFQLSSHFLRGKDAAPIQLSDGTSVGVLVCYEDTSPSLVRESSLQKPDFLICIINASAFKHAIAMQQHLRLAQLRTIENRKYLARAAGTGISCGVSPWGEITDVVPTDAVQSIRLEAPKLQILTYYTKFGNWVGALCLLTSIATILIATFQGRRSQENR